MPRPLDAIFPSPEVLLAMEPEEIAGFLLEYLHELEGTNAFLHRTNLTGADGPFYHYVGAHFQKVCNAIAEAWMWLLRDGMIAPRPDAAAMDIVFVTRRGRQFENHGALEAYRRAALLHDETLDGLLAQRVVPAFRRGDYDTAVFTAFKEVEVRVRAAGGYSHGEIGTQLMQAAFNPESGPLTDTTRESSERVAMMSLFAGALGMFKNPGSHRNVEFDASEAAALIHFANYLLGVVEARRAASL
jgi:uncharacterized protein (TIGR02391 family)